MTVVEKTENEAEIERGEDAETFDFEMVAHGGVGAAGIKHETRV